MFNSACIDEYGRPLVPLDEDKLNGAKPLRIQDQIVTDENGKRRFHGAFTGGFSAGYWNTVGSQEGWKPQSFKSSRAEKAQPLGQKPLDFMDDEDLEEFGSAPLSLQDREEDPTLITQDEIDLKRVLNLDKSKIMAAAEPELKAKNAEKEKRKLTEFNKRKLYVLEKYGCDTTNPKNVWHGVAEEEMIAAFEPVGETVAIETPPVYENISIAPETKTDNFGLGDYTPLTASEDASAPSISESSNNDKRMSTPLEVAVASKNKKLSIRGQAFGVGALEEEDEDIYEKEDMSRYDFTLESRKKKQGFIKMLVQDDDVSDDKPLSDSQPKIERDSRTDLNEKLNQTKVTANEVSTKHESIEKQMFLKPRPWSEKKSRFGPPVDDGQETKQDVNKNTKQIIEINADYIEKRKKDIIASIAAKSNSFVTAGIINPNESNFEIQKQEEKDTKRIDFPTNTSSFKPFPLNEAKQRRYEQFLESNACSEKEIEEFLYTIQPPEMSKWDREMELKEFIQSRKLYRPLDGLMANRFVPSINNEDIQTTAITTPAELQIEKQKRKIVVERTTVTWKPCAQLCKRYNIAEPLSTRSRGESKNEQMKQKKTSQISIFDYIEGSVHNKTDFVTPVIIPKRSQTKTEEVRHQSNSIGPGVGVQQKEHKATAPEVATPRKSRWSIKEQEEEKQEQVQNEKPKTTTASVKETEEKAAKLIESNDQNDGKQRLSFIPKSERNVDKHSQATSASLFQAIFNDSGEGDEKHEQQQQEQQITEGTKIPQSLFYSTGTRATTAAAANLLRNTSPPRGIFAALFNENYEKVKEKSNNQEDAEGSLKKRTCNREDPNEVKNDCYGPALPINFYTSNTEKNQGHPVAKEQHIEVSGHRIKYKGLEIVEEWVEKGDQNGSESDTDSSDSSSCKTSRKRKHKSKSKKAKKSKKSKKQSKEKYKKLRHK